MNKYIEKNEAQKRIASIATLAKSDAQEALMGRVLYCIDHIPAADVATVRHGRWLCVDTDTEQFFLCNRCKKKEYWESNYCPNCGAKMKEEKAHETDPV